MYIDSAAEGEIASALIQTIGLLIAALGGTITVVAQLRHSDTRRFHEKKFEMYAEFIDKYKLFMLKKVPKRKPKKTEENDLTNELYEILSISNKFGIVSSKEINQAAGLMLEVTRLQFKSYLENRPTHKDIIGVSIKAQNLFSEMCRNELSAVNRKLEWFKLISLKNFMKKMKTKDEENRKGNT